MRRRRLDTSTPHNAPQQGARKRTCRQVPTTAGSRVMVPAVTSATAAPSTSRHSRPGRRCRQSCALRCRWEGVWGCAEQTDAQAKQAGGRAVCESKHSWAALTLSRLKPLPSRPPPALARMRKGSCNSHCAGRWAGQSLRVRQRSNQCHSAQHTGLPPHPHQPTSRPCPCLQVGERVGPRKGQHAGAHAWVQLRGGEHGTEAGQEAAPGQLAAPHAGGLLQGKQHAWAGEGRAQRVRVWTLPGLQGASTDSCRVC